MLQKDRVNKKIGFWQITSVLHTIIIEGSLREAAIGREASIPSVNLAHGANHTIIRQTASEASCIDGGSTDFLL